MSLKNTIPHSLNTTLYLKQFHKGLQLCDKVASAVLQRRHPRLQLIFPLSKQQQFSH